MIGDNAFDVIHTAVANFDSILIEDFVEYVSLWKMFVNEWYRKSCAILLPTFLL